MPQIDHIVLWVEDPLRSVEFYTRVVGLTAVRVAEFRESRAPFPSVRLDAHTIFDLMPRAMAAGFNARIKSLNGVESAGNLVNHVCLAMRKSEYDELRARLEAEGTALPVVMTDSFGAQGQAPEAFYFADPDGNLLEARWYA